MKKKLKKHKKEVSKGLAPVPAKTLGGIIARVQKLVGKNELENISIKGKAGKLTISGKTPKGQVIAEWNNLDIGFPEAEAAVPAVILANALRGIKSVVWETGKNQFILRSEDKGNYEVNLSTLPFVPIEITKEEETASEVPPAIVSLVGGVAENKLLGITDIITGLPAVVSLKWGKGQANILQSSSYHGILIEAEAEISEGGNLLIPADSLSLFPMASGSIILKKNSIVLTIDEGEIKYSLEAMREDGEEGKAIPIETFIKTAEKAKDADLSFSLNSEEFNAAVERCGGVVEYSKSMLLKLHKAGSVEVSSSGRFGSTKEKVKIEGLKGKTKDLSLSFQTFGQLIALFGGNLTMKEKGGVLAVEGTANEEKWKITGLAALYEN